MLHFNEQFRQLDEISNDSEKFPPTVKLTLLQTAVSPSKPPFRPQSQQSRPKKSFKRYDGPIYLPPQIFKLLSHDAMKALKAYITQAIHRFHQRKVHNTEVVEIPQEDPPEPSVPDSGLSDLPESDLVIPDDPILDFVNSQCHCSEVLDQALQAYQAYHVPRIPLQFLRRTLTTIIPTM